MSSVQMIISHVFPWLHCGAVYCNRSCLCVCVRACDGRAGGVRTLLHPARAQCLRLSERFFSFPVVVTTATPAISCRSKTQSGVRPAFRYWPIQAVLLTERIVKTWLQPDRRTDGHRTTAKTALTHSVARQKPKGLRFVSAYRFRR